MSFDNLPQGTYWQSRLGNNPDNIGGNCHLYATIGSDESAKTVVMVDRGIKFGAPEGYNAVLATPEGLYDGVSALVVTHPHEDHLGAIKHDVEMGLKLPPIYGSAFTAAMLEKSLGPKGMAEVDMRVVDPNQSVDIGDMKITMFPVDHMPGARGLHIQTPDSSIVHTGDFKFDETLRLGERADPAQWLKMGRDGVDVLVADSTSATTEGKRVTEEEVAANLKAIVADRPNQGIVAGVLGSQMDRMASLARVAHETGRLPVIVGRSVENNVAALVRSGEDLSKGSNSSAQDLREKWGDRVPPRSRIDFRGGFVTAKQAQAMGLKPREMLVITTGAFGQEMTGLARAARGEHPILKLDSNWTMIRPQRIIPVADVQQAVAVMDRNLTSTGVEMIPAERTEGLGYGPIHKSGHADKGDVLRAYALLRPGMVVPIHGNAKQLDEHAAVAREAGVSSLSVPTNGAIVRMQSGAVEVVRREPMQLVAVRESGYGNYSYDKLGADGRPTGPLPMAANRQRERGQDVGRRSDKEDGGRPAAYHRARRRAGR